MGIPRQNHAKKPCASNRCWFYARSAEGGERCRILKNDEQPRSTTQSSSYKLQRAGNRSMRSRCRYISPHIVRMGDTLCDETEDAARLQHPPPGLDRCNNTHSHNRRARRIDITGDEHRKLQTFAKCACPVYCTRCAGNSFSSNTSAMHAQAPTPIPASMAMAAGNINAEIAGHGQGKGRERKGREGKKEGRREETATKQTIRAQRIHHIQRPDGTRSPPAPPPSHRRAFPKAHARSSVPGISAPRPCRECSPAEPSTLPRAACGRDPREATSSLSSSRDPAIGTGGARAFVFGESIG